MTNLEQLALANCEREPIHIPGRIQTFGHVLAFRLKDFVIVGATEEFPQAGEVREDPLGKPLGDVLVSRELLHAIRNALGLPTIRFQRERLGIYEFAGERVDIAVHIMPGAGERGEGETAILEYEVLDGECVTPEITVARVRNLLGELSHTKTLEEFLGSSVTTLRRVTGFDRVMCYRFLADESGEVAAEAKAVGLEAFLGLRYPAYDIPVQVRAMALLMPVRVIADIADSHRQIRSESSLSIDLTYCYSRGISPIHVEYLRNMGVQSTMNLSIIVNGQLWGLFAFHHGRRRRLSPELRTITELYGEFFSSKLQQLLEMKSFERRKLVFSFRQLVRRESGMSFVEAFTRFRQELMDFVDADGTALIADDQVLCFGQCPESKGEIRKLASQMNQELCVVDCLATLEESPDESTLGGVAGVMSLSLDDEMGYQVLFFRGEQAEEVRWAGRPTKEIQTGPLGPRLHPRASFEEYRQIVRGRSRPWRDSDISIATELRTTFLELLLNNTKLTTKAWRKQRDQQDLLIGELNHRVKNILMLVQAIARQTRLSALSLDDYLEAFQKRIDALSKAHELIGPGRIQWASLMEILQIEFQPYLTSAEDRIVMKGPEIGFRPDVAPVMSLVMHELASNAVKHGILAEESGTLSIEWSYSAGGLRLEWKETFGTARPLGSGRGFGLSLIERAIPHECSGTVELLFSPVSFTATMWLPSSFVKVLKESSALESKELTRGLRQLPKLDKLALQNCMILEDNAIIATELEQMLMSVGASNVTVCSSQFAALSNVETSCFDFVILDVNLGNENSEKIAHRLLQLKIPFVFVTGYEQTHSRNPEFDTIPKLTKPVSQVELYLAVATCVGKHDEIIDT